MATNVEALAGAPPTDQEMLQRCETLQSAEIARVKASLFRLILAVITRKDRVYPEGFSPEQMVRDFREELASVEKHGLDSMSLEEYAAREASIDAGQDGFDFWRNADDEAIQAIDRERLASIIAGAVASFLVKAEVSEFHLNELIVSGPGRPANDQVGRPDVELENKHAA